jgi:predicted CoA-binding protein
MECEFPKSNATDAEIGEMLASAKTIAVVGISPKAERPSHWIAKYLMDHGYRVFGVNPGLSELFGQRVYKTLADVPEPIDIVDIFRQPDAVPLIVDDAIKLKAKVIWMQQGIVNNQAADTARAAGLKVVMNKCIYKEHTGRGL